MGGSLLLATSRRTPPAASDAALDALAALPVPSRAWLPDAAPNPYLGLLAWADYLLVTPDSISMASEACGAGKPVYLWRPRECRRRFRAFHERLIDSGRAREWRGELERPSLWRGGAQPPTAEDEESDVSRAAARVRQMLAERGVVIAEGEPK